MMFVQVIDWYTVCTLIESLGYGIENPWMYNRVYLELDGVQSKYKSILNG